MNSSSGASSETKICSCVSWLVATVADNYPLPLTATGCFTEHGDLWPLLQTLVLLFAVDKLLIFHFSVAQNLRT